MSAGSQPTSAEVRAWETETGRNHAAAAEHFRSLGCDVDEAAIADLYRRRTPKQADQVPPPPAAQPPQLPAVVPKGPASEMDELDDLRDRYNIMRTAFDNASPRDIAPIERQLQAMRVRINEVQAAREAASSRGQTTDQRLEAMRARMEGWPDRALEVPVRIYLRRYGLRLCNADGAIVDREASNREEPEA